MAPSYARATASSVLKTTPTSSPLKTADAKTLNTSATSPSKPKDYLTPTTTPTKKLKRPSPLTPQVRQSILYKADLFPIHPQDSSKPCPLASLPSELRTQIYLHALSPSFAVPQPRFILRPRTSSLHYVFPSILHISRAIRIEAAYVYYTCTPFSFTIRNFDMTAVVSWLDTLPVRHRGLLARNQSLSIRMVPGLRVGYTYPPQGYMLDDWLSNHWKKCSAYGNLYTIKSDNHRLHFILFCRLLGWFQLNEKMPWRGVKWRYVFDEQDLKSVWGRLTGAQTCWLLMEHVAVLGMRCVARAWVRGNGERRGREEACRFLGALDEAFRMTESDESKKEKWKGEMEHLRKAVESW
jgi:hypothetical protein